MYNLFSLILTLTICLNSTPSFSETMDNLVERHGVYYKKLSKIPFSGQIWGETNGSFKNGKPEGLWTSFWRNGRTRAEVKYQNGRLEGAWVGYHENGQLESEGNYKDDKRQGIWAFYYDTGQLLAKGDSKHGKFEGSWVGYRKDGTVWEKWTGTYKNGQKVDN